MAAEHVSSSGETGPISASLPVNMAIAGLFAIACYNCLEILISLLSRFKRHDGLYFWSMVTATLGIVLHSIVVMLRYYSLGPNFLLCVLTCIGWYGMVTGQSVVLYSRLHLIVEDKSKTRWVLYMIIINFFILHVPTTVLFLMSNTQRYESRFIGPFNVYERIQLAGFCIQETIISGLYIWETARGLKPIFAVRKDMERKVIRYLVIVNILVILLDISLIITQYMSHFNIQTTYKPVVYSIKLKMEFVVLNKLLLLVQHSDCNCMHIMGEPENTTQDPSHLESQSTDQNSSTRTGSDVPMHMNKFHTDASSQSRDHQSKSQPWNFLDLTPYSTQARAFTALADSPVPKPSPGSKAPVRCKGQWRQAWIKATKPRKLPEVAGNSDAKGNSRYLAVVTGVWVADDGTSGIAE